MTLSNQRVERASDLTLTNTTFTDLTSMTLTLPNNTGVSLLYFCAPTRNSVNTEVSVEIRFVDNTTNIQGVNGQHSPNTAGVELCSTLTFIADNDGQAVKVQNKMNRGTTIYFGSNEKFTQYESIEVA